MGLPKNRNMTKIRVLGDVIGRRPIIWHGRIASGYRVNRTSALPFRRVLKLDAESAGVAGQLFEDRDGPVERFLQSSERDVLRLVGTGLDRMLYFFQIELHVPKVWECVV